MALILANDGIDAAGKSLLEQGGHTVLTDKVPQHALASFIKENNVAALLVRSATQVTATELATGSVKVVGRAGVGMDNIDVQFAHEAGIAVVNTPASSSRSVAELVMAHALGLLRYLPQSNRQMPAVGDTSFAQLKKDFAEGGEVENRTIGIIGCGRIGRATAQLALGMGMKVVAFDPSVAQCALTFAIHGHGSITVPIHMVTLPELLAQSDIVSLHIPKPEHGAMIAAPEFALMKKSAIIINASRGGVIDESALLHALDTGVIAGAGLDVFDNEPTPNMRLLQHPRISCTPHIGAATDEAQQRIGIELAKKVLDILD